MKRLRPRRTAKRSVEARRVALREKKSKSSPLQGWVTTPRGYCWGRHLRPSTEGQRTTLMPRQGLLPARQAKRREAKTKETKAKTKPGEERRRSKRQRRRRSRAKKVEDQGAKGEDEGKRSEAKANAPFAKSKTIKGRRRRASTSEAAKGS